jgi:formate dehydrogenase iron-sulfur subunit
MVACAFSVPKYEWGKLNPRVRKCIMCPDRVSQGLATACATACPTGATKFGDHDALIAEAKDRIRNNPENYVDHIYGLNEVGGTGVLMLSSVPFEQFGLPKIQRIGEEPLPEYTGRVMEMMPDFIPLWALVLGGVYWVSNRRAEVAEVEAEEKAMRGAK